MNDHSKLKIAVIGMGYVGLPLAIEFAKKFEVIGFDSNSKRIEELKMSLDSTKEISASILESSEIAYTSNTQKISSCNVFIITVPTPIDSNNLPDLTSLESATTTIGKILKNGDVIIYESTVYPGATEEVCVPILEEQSGLLFNKDFFLGYSPERINPGDKSHTVTSILKVTSGSNPETADFVNNLYSQIIDAGTYKASSIKVAEAAKVIENIQRDVNIALINELSMIFNKIDVDTEEVLKAAETKWNFMSVRPGLVGGHCIGVDPYYLTYKAQSIGHQPNMILAGRDINESMSKFVVEMLCNEMEKRSMTIAGNNVLVLGFTFKENCPDVRNTKIIDLVNLLKDKEINVDVYDKWADEKIVQDEYGLELISEISGNYDAIILSVAHDEFKKLSIDKIRSYGNKDSIIFDLKHILKQENSDLRL